MGAFVDPSTATTFANTDWEHYLSGRPVYPPSLRDIIYSYRRSHDAGWTRLVDIGAGLGTACAMFLGDFERVHSSDASLANQRMAKLYLNELVQNGGLNTKLDFTLSRGEDAAKHIGNNAADLVLVGTAAHWMEPDELLESIARILKPGGTMAIFNYWIPCFPGKSERFGQVFNDSLWTGLKLSIPTSDTLTSARFDTCMSRLDSGGGGNDFIPIPSKYFDDPQRIRINWTDENEKQFRYMTRVAWPLSESIASRVTREDKVLSFQSDKDPEADGWAFEVDKAWLNRFHETFRSTQTLSTEQETAVYSDWDRVFAEECPSGKVLTEWPFQVLLGTRKASAPNEI